MGKKIPVVIGATEFDSKEEAKRYIRVKVIDAFDGAPRIPAGPIHDFVEDLLNLHESATEKIGPGIDHFRVDPASDWKSGFPVKSTNRTLVVVRTNGDPIDWSWDSIVTNPSLITRKRIALRNATYDSIREIKQKALAAGPATCARTGATIAKIDDAQVRHHSPSFAQLADDFAATVGGWASIDTKSSGVGPEISDPSIEAAWVAYFDAHVSPSIELKY